MPISSCRGTPISRVCSLRRLRPGPITDRDFISRRFVSPPVCITLSEGDRSSLTPVRAIPSLTADVTVVTERVIMRRLSPTSATGSYSGLRVSILPPEG